MNWTAIAACATGEMGEAMQAAMASDTPPHPGTPYATLDGKALDTSASGEMLIQTVCDAIRIARNGTDMPKACQ